MAPWLFGPRVLELGCGVGRVTAHLLSAGYEVTAVDNSPEMLAHVPHQAARVLSDIEDLELRATFDAAILASCLINTPVPAQRQAMLNACFAHLRPGGRLLFERFDPDWLSTVQVGRVGSSGGVETYVDRVTRSAEEVSISLRYRVDESEWLQHFDAVSLDDGQIASCLTAANFNAPSWINKRWGYADNNAV